MAGLEVELERPVVLVEDEVDERVEGVADFLMVTAIDKVEEQLMTLVGVSTGEATRGTL